MVKVRPTDWTPRKRSEVLGLASWPTPFNLKSEVLELNYKIHVLKLNHENYVLVLNYYVCTCTLLTNTSF